MRPLQGGAVGWLLMRFLSIQMSCGAAAVLLWVSWARQAWPHCQTIVALMRLLLTSLARGCTHLHVLRSYHGRAAAS